MTYVEKHSAIAAGLMSGKSNRELAKELGVSHGMIQKHRSGETGMASPQLPRGGGNSRGRDLCHVPVTIEEEEEHRPLENCTECEGIAFYGICWRCGRVKTCTHCSLPNDVGGVGGY